MIYGRDGVGFTVMPMFYPVISSTKLTAVEKLVFSLIGMYEVRDMNTVELAIEAGITENEAYDTIVSLLEKEAILPVKEEDGVLWLKTNLDFFLEGK